MISVLSFYRGGRLRRALRDYPLILFPHPARETDLPRSQALKNFEFFLEIKEARIEGMGEWFQRHFHQDLTFDQRGVRSLSKWIDLYGMYAVEPKFESRLAWDTYTPAWIDNMRSLNLVYDTAIFYGDYVVKSCPKLRWAFFDKKPLAPPSVRKESFYRPSITGLTVERKIDPLNTAFNIIATQRRDAPSFRLI